MLPNFLVPEFVAREDGVSPATDLGAAQGKLLQLTLGINRIIEQESLDISLWGSPDGENWGATALVSFPQKFYCGTYSILVDLTEQPDVRFVRAQWKMARWGRGEPKPLFGFYLFAQEATSSVMSAAS